MENAIINIYFPYPTDYTGRNGDGIQHGISIHKRAKLVDLCPINSKGISKAALLSIPINELKSFAEAIRSLIEE